MSNKLFHEVDSLSTTRYTYAPEAESKFIIGHTDDDSDWIELRAELTVREANNLVMAFPQGEERDTRAGLQFAEKLFDLTAVDWSFTRQDGTKVLPSSQELHNLPSQAGRWVNDVLGRHMQTLMGSEVDRAEGEVSGSQKTT